MSCKYSYYEIFSTYGTQLRNIFLGNNTYPYLFPSSSNTLIPAGEDETLSVTPPLQNTNRCLLAQTEVTDNNAFENNIITVSSPPYSIYEIKDQYNLDTWSGNFKGMLVWNAQSYYSELLIQSSTTDVVETAGSYTNDVGFYVVPNFGRVSIIPNVEYRQIVVITFDSQSSPDYDPYGINIIRYIDWFINKHNVLLEQFNSQFSLPTTGQRLYMIMNTISDPTFLPSSTYTRRSVMYTLRYCRC